MGGKDGESRILTDSGEERRKRARKRVTENERPTALRQHRSLGVWFPRCCPPPFLQLSPGHPPALPQAVVVGVSVCERMWRGHVPLAEGPGSALP